MQKKCIVQIHRKHGSILKCLKVDLEHAMLLCVEDAWYPGQAEIVKKRNSYKT